ncbi:MAG: hypothetical protein WC346_16275 [Methanogenium sp.]|jgi:hypothetical protein
MSIFSEYSDQIVADVEKNYKPIDAVDALTFLTSSEYMGEDLLPIQRVIIKTLYNLWGIYPPDYEEQTILNTLKNEWGITLDLMRTDPVKYLVLILGRRSTKSTTISFIATYEPYTLICKDNPQEYYGIRDRHPITIMHVASAGDQAEDVFTLTKDNIRKVPFFHPYIDFSKDTSTELRLFTPYDLRKNDEIRYKNSLILRGSGQPKESLLHGSIIIESVTTSAATHRGKSIKTLMLSEFAHFERGKVGGDADAAIYSENPKTDYAIWKAFTPSVKDYREDGKILVESSPKEKGGECYNQYCIAGGIEQEKREEIIPDPQYQLIQLSTWQARFTDFSYEDFEGDFRKDPVGAAMEYGAHFGNPAGSFIQEEWIERVSQRMVPMIITNPKNLKFVISIDPGGKAKKKKADTYVVGWGHSEGMIRGDYGEEDNMLYWVDGMEGWDAKIIPEGNGKFRQEPVNPNIVVEFILDLIDKLGGRNFIQEIVFDQFDSSSPIATLQGLGLPAIETTFTNPYKSAMYGNYLQKLIADQVRMYGIDERGYIARWKLEMKHLQRITQGNYTFYQHPTSGPVQNDDFADCSANLIHRLCLIATPTQKSIQQARLNKSYPIQVKRGPKPIMARNIHSGTSLLGRK